jgi:hypothetical protein
MIRYAICGAIYGMGLAALSFLAAGAGHGTYVVLGLASAPLGILGITVALIGLPFWWTGLFVLARRNQGAFIGAMLVHYLSGAVLLTNHRFADSFGDWNYFAGMWATSRAFLVGWFVWYLAGQMFLWIGLLSRVPLARLRDKA